MLNFITNYLDAKNERRLKSSRLALEMTLAQISIISKVSEMYMVAAQNKCLSCKHKFEKRWSDEKIISAKIQEDEVVLSKDMLNNIQKIKEAAE